MEKQTQYHHQQQQLLIQQQQQQQQALKCPRCDSHNTKFCYYNNYSLSQPRHFCKSCKRYWTRGGTLRNVPVGGGCRKNKKVVKKFSISAVDLPSSTSSLPSTTITNPNLNPPMFYGVPVDSSSYKVVNVDKVSDDTDHRTQMSRAHGLGFENSDSILSSYPSLYWSSTTSLEEQQKYILDGKFIGQASHVHDAKMDKSQNKIDWFNNFVPGSFENQIQQVGSSSDSSLLWMLDHANNGSSAP